MVKYLGTWYLGKQGSLERINVIAAPLHDLCSSPGISTYRIKGFKFVALIFLSGWIRRFLNILSLCRDAAPLLHLVYLTFSKKYVRCYKLWWTDVTLTQRA